MSILVGKPPPNRRGCIIAKRFTDSKKWDDPWFLDLPSKYKLLWMLILDKCNHAGIYKVNLRLASFMINEEFKRDEVLKFFKDRIQVLSDEKWFVPKFINFQYGVLNESVNCHKSVIAELKRGRVDEQLINSCLTLQDKNKNKDKDKAQDLKGGVQGGKAKKHKHGEYQNVKLSDTEYDKLTIKFGEVKRDKWIKTLDEGIELKGYKYKSHYLAILNWSKKEGESHGQGNNRFRNEEPGKYDSITTIIE